MAECLRPNHYFQDIRRLSKTIYKSVSAYFENSNYSLVGIRHQLSRNRGLFSSTPPTVGCQHQKRGRIWEYSPIVGQFVAMFEVAFERNPCMLHLISQHLDVYAQLLQVLEQTRRILHVWSERLPGCIYLVKTNLLN